MHETCLVIKIWSNIKTSSCFHFVATCQHDFTQQAWGGGREGRIHGVKFPNYNLDHVEEKQQINNGVASQ